MGEIMIYPIINQNVFINLYNLNYITIIDIRNKDEFNYYHIPNSINMKEDDLYHNFSDHLSFNNTYFLICNKGQSSLSLALFLSQKGYKTYSVNGGIQNFNGPLNSILRC